MSLTMMEDYTKEDQYKYLMDMLQERTGEYKKYCSLLQHSFLDGGKKKKGIPDTDVIYRQAENALLLVDNARRQLADWLLDNGRYVHVGEFGELPP